MDKNDFYSSYAGDTPALVFFDAVHTYEEVRADIDWAKNVNAVVICGHDYNSKEYLAWPERSMNLAGQGMW